ncbi:Periplasmic serine endoprotease DegP [compost metagenome]
MRRGWIGVEPNELSPELAETFGVKADAGVIITGVLQNGPAAKAGIRPGDVITSVAGRSVGNVAQLLSAVAALTPGQVATLDVVRKDGKTRIDVTPGKRTQQPKLQEQR